MRSNEPTASRRRRAAAPIRPAATAHFAIAPACLTSHLSLSVARAAAAAGTAYTWYDLENTGPTICSMFGYPGVAVLTAHGRIVQHPATRGAALPARVRLVTLKPGHRAQFLLNSTDTIPSPGCPRAYRGVRLAGLPAESETGAADALHPALLQPQSRAGRTRPRALVTSARRSERHPERGRQGRPGATSLERPPPLRIELLAVVRFGRLKRRLGYRRATTRSAINTVSTQSGVFPPRSIKPTTTRIPGGSAEHHGELGRGSAEQRGSHLVRKVPAGKTDVSLARVATQSEAALRRTLDEMIEMDDIHNSWPADAQPIARLVESVLSTSHLGVQPDFCFDRIASRDIASTAAGQTVVRVAERSFQVVELDGSRDSLSDSRVGFGREPAADLSFRTLPRASADAPDYSASPGVRRPYRVGFSRHPSMLRLRHPRRHRDAGGCGLWRQQRAIHERGRKEVPRRDRHRGHERGREREVGSCRRQRDEQRLPHHTRSEPGERRGRTRLDGPERPELSSRHRGNEVYINGTTAFWQKFAGNAAAQLLFGKWIKAPASGQLATLATLTDLQKLFNQLLSSHGQLAKGSITTVRGQRVIAVKDTANGGTLYVATTGTPYPIEVVKNGSERRADRVRPLQPAGQADAAEQRDRHLTVAVTVSPSPREFRHLPEGERAQARLFIAGLGASVLGTGRLGAGSLASAPAAFAKGSLSQGDAGILRLLSAAEILEADLGRQYNELCGLRDREAPGGSRNKAFTNALTLLDSSTPTWRSATEDEFTYFTFINAYLKSREASPVNLDQFRTLLASAATGAANRKPTATMHDSVNKQRERPQNLKMFIDRVLDASLAVLQAWRAQEQEPEAQPV